MTGSKAISSLQHQHKLIGRSRSMVCMSASKSTEAEVIATEDPTVLIEAQDASGQVIEEFQDKEFADGFKKADQSLSILTGQEDENLQEVEGKNDPSSKKMRLAKKLTKKPGKILIYCNSFDQEILPEFVEMYKYISSQYPEVEIFTEKWILDQAQNQFDKAPTLFENQNEQERENIDFIIVMGGDRTVLKASKQFRFGKIPPILSFKMQSYGYLCNYQFADHRKVIDQVMNLDQNLDLDERLRLKMNLPENSERDIYRGNDLKPTSKMNVEGYHILNELVIDRGPSPYAIQIEIYFDGQYMTTMVGDGLVVATPSGSTAYNLSAGGSIVQSNTECICVTPMAPHSLSFRPVVLPASTTITLRKPNDNRNSAWVSLDGATRFELRDGEEFHLEAADTKLDMVADSNELMKLWGKRLVQLLNWNQRQPQKAFTRRRTGDANLADGEQEDCEVPESQL